MAIQILIVEDDLILAETYKAFLSEIPCEISIVTTGEEAMNALSLDIPDIILLDLLLPDINGQKILKWLNDQNISTNCIVITSEASADKAVKALKAGANDYLVKPINEDRIKTTINNQVEKILLNKQIATYQKIIPTIRYEKFLGQSPQIQLVYNIIDSAAPSDANVFITGESGTGKELCAEAIHKRSNRRDHPFITLNCAAIPRDLIESELFGHVKGAFTGANNNRKGAATQAAGGTLFLDEICELDINLQSKLLRFIQTKEFQPIGSDDKQVADIRFVCATNRDPWKEVEEGRFREDLYYRLHVVPINMPPLRDRGDDVLLLAQNFLKYFSQELNKQCTGFDNEVINTFRHYDWPGNVRELHNLIHRLCVMSSGGEITLSMLPTFNNTENNHSEINTPKISSSNIRELWEEERDIIERAINICNGNIAEAAKKLGISDSTIYRKQKKWN